jgi:predicted nuclease of predicted toxin-antitoxin system
MAHADGRVVLAHDSDFGTLVITQDEPFTGIVYLRPGHIDPEFTIETLQTVAVQPLDVKPPFIVVAEQKARTVRIRLRCL